MAGDRSVSPRYSKVQHTTRTDPHAERPSLRRSSFSGNRSLLWMLLSLLGGSALSVGHHFFYASFDGLRVNSVSISQTWVIRSGTVFAFIVQSLLVVATSIALAQQTWAVLSRNQFKIRQIDTMTGVLSNALCFVQSRIWLRFPILTILAMVAWLLPVAAVVTPATINVVARTDIQNVESTPPQLYFDPERYASLQIFQSRNSYVGPSSDTLSTAFGSAMTKQLLGISQEHPNMTYELQFHGPALRCDPADAAFISGVRDAYMENRSFGYKWHFFAWVPAIGVNRTDFLTATRPGTSATFDDISSDAAHLYVIPSTSFSVPWFLGAQQMDSKDDRYGYNDTLDCKLYNASYKASFNLTFPTQTIEIVSKQFLNPVSLSWDILDWLNSRAPHVRYREAQRICYQAIMDSFGRLLVGAERWDDEAAGTRKTTINTSWNMMAIDWDTRNGTQKGLEDLFQNITLSMLSSPSLIMNSTIAAQNRVRVNVFTSHNVYKYSPGGLWLAYGIACGAALLSTLLGVYGIWRNGGVGYQSTFSTYIRTTRDLKLKDLVEPDDRGTEPLPGKLAEARILLDT